MKKAFWLSLTLILIISFLFTGCQRGQNGVYSDPPEETPHIDIEEDDNYDKNTFTPLPTEPPYVDPNQDAPNDGDTSVIIEAVRVTGNTVNIRKENTMSSEVIAQAERNDIYQLLEERLDSENRTWYLIECGFGQKGWIAGWLCEKTDEKPYVYKSQKGSLLDPEIDEELYIRALLLEEHSVESFEKEFGHNYTGKPDGAWTRYIYPSGLFFELDTQNEFIYYGFGEDRSYINPRSITKKVCDIYSNPGDELLILFEYGIYYRILVCDAETKDVLREYRLDYLRLDEFEVGDFMNDGSLQLYLDGHGDGIFKKGIYQVVDDDFVEVLNIRSFDQYNANIKAAINGNNFSMTVQIGDYKKSFTSVLPDKVFYDTRDVKDKSKLLSVDSDWSIIKNGGKWLVQVQAKVNYPMIYYYWGPPGLDAGYNSIMHNDLARVFIDLSLKDNEHGIIDVNAEIKYNNPELLAIEPLGYDEIRLVDGPMVEMSMEKAYEALGGNLEDFEYSDYIEYNGVALFEFCGCIVEITVTNPDYETPRGLRVGDTIEKVESLYGKPDFGFSGDDYVFYKCADNGYVNYYRGLNIYYENDVVRAFLLYQVILD